MSLVFRPLELLSEIGHKPEAEQSHTESGSETFLITDTSLMSNSSLVSMAVLSCTTISEQLFWRLRQRLGS